MLTEPKAGGIMKTGKAVIANGGVTPPKTHDLVKLAKLGKLYFEMQLYYLYY